MAQTRAFGSALDDAGNIRHHEGHALLHIDHTQIGIEGGEVVIGDLGAGIGGDGQQG